MEFIHGDSLAFSSLPFMPDILPGFSFPEERESPVMGWTVI